jgi:hypothetical protein
VVCSRADKGTSCLFGSSAPVASSGATGVLNFAGSFLFVVGDRHWRPAEGNTVGRSFSIYADRSFPTVSSAA